MTVAEVRTKYLDFFEKRGHTIIPSAPIVPENDPTTLFTSSGMQPLVPYLLGQPHPEGTRLADSQLSFRAGDIEEVGDNRHTTFFEMLGNWSLGDYFKAEQLPWFYEFLTSKEEGLGLDPERLYVTTFSGDEESGMAADEESVAIWQKIGIPKERMSTYGAKKNWWSRAGVPANMPPGEIGGPDSEVFYDFGLPHDPAFGAECHPNCDCGRFMEIGNSVFMEYLKRPDGSFAKLPKQNVDFGGGLERLTAATLDNPDVFLIDVFQDVLIEIKNKYGIDYHAASQETKYSLRIILDHLRAALFIAAQGVAPSNTEQGYVLRRLLRRAIYHGYKLARGFSNLYPLTNSFIEIYKDFYPYLDKQRGIVHEVFESEEIKFGKTLERGLQEINKLQMLGGFTRVDAGGELPTLNRVDAKKAFYIRQTFGYPLELIQEELANRGLLVDHTEFEKELKREVEEHQTKSRAGAAQKFAGGLADHAEQTIRYHTAHHLLLKALQIVLGPEVHQRGSNITSERLRMDFSYGQKMTPEQIAEVENIVNEKIAEAIPVIRTDMKREEAEKLGAEHEFGASYPETVSVYSVGPLDTAFSIEFCGGPHVENTGELAKGGKRFKIIKEEASSAGIRRIRAMLQ
jgi:alanyl-tRNA synthetase